jgi:hypothetical protein
MGKSATEHGRICNRAWADLQQGTRGSATGHARLFQGSNDRRLATFSVNLDQTHTL